MDNLAGQWIAQCLHYLRPCSEPKLEWSDLPGTDSRTAKQAE